MQRQHHPLDAPRSIFVVMPVYNEEHAIYAALESLIKQHYLVVVVDDGSTDRTWSIVTTLPVYTLRHPINLGQGAALQTGIQFALQRGAEIIVHFDADGQHWAEDIPRLIEPLYQGEADVVLGSRFLRKADMEAVPPTRRVLLRAAVVVDGLMTGVWLTDTHNGFRALTRAAASKIKLRENRFAHATEILSQIRQHRLRYVERPTAIIYSDYSAAKGQSMWNALNIIVDLLLRKVFR
jgi:glycosyltransferase involved in cell wall biosynthesis